MSHLSFLYHFINLLPLEHTLWTITSAFVRPCHHMATKLLLQLKHGPVKGQSCVLVMFKHLWYCLHVEATARLRRNEGTTQRLLVLFLFPSFFDISKFTPKLYSPSHSTLKRLFLATGLTGRLRNMLIPLKGNLLQSILWPLWTLYYQFWPKYQCTATLSFATSQQTMARCRWLKLRLPHEIHYLFFFFSFSLLSAE